MIGTAINNIDKIHSIDGYVAECLKNNMMNNQATLKDGDNMNKYIWLKDKEALTAIMLNKIDSLRICYVPYTDLCHTSMDKCVLNIYTASRVYAEEYKTQREAKNRMDKILGLIIGEEE
jgi:hypothetical protein